MTDAGMENESLDGVVTGELLEWLPDGLATLLRTGVLRLAPSNEKLYDAVLDVCESGLHAPFVIRIKDDPLERPRHYCTGCGEEVYLFPGNLVLADDQPYLQGDLFFRTNHGRDMGPI